jgi:hypothetical protein
MGQEQRVLFSGRQTPPWQAVSTLLSQASFPAVLRMIDGQLAFPDEMPGEGWEELRVGTPQGMVTVRREADQVSFVTWGNADGRELEAWNALAWGFAEAGGGHILTGEGPVTAAEFQRTARLPDALREKGS